MSSMLNPVGPEEPSVYWQRRAVVGVGLLVALWLLWMLFSSVFGSDGQGPAEQPVASVASQSPSPSASDSEKAAEEKAAAEKAAAEKAAAAKAAAEKAAAEKAAAEKAAAEKAAAEKAAAEKAAAEKAAAEAAKPPVCDAGNLDVFAEPSTKTPDAGAGLQVKMTVTNTSKTDCRQDLRASANEVRIVSGRVLVWSSDYCATAADGLAEAAEPTVLKAGASWSTTVTWPGRVTASSCPQTQPTAQPGTYRAVAQSGPVVSREAVFVVR